MAAMVEVYGEGFTEAQRERAAAAASRIFLRESMHPRAACGALWEVARMEFDGQLPSAGDGVSHRYNVWCEACEVVRAICGPSARLDVAR